MKLIVQVPCLNEELTLAAVLTSIPTKIPGITSIEVVVIDDGCSDRTVEIARAHGVQHIIRHARTMGLARSFKDGIDYALARRFHRWHWWGSCRDVKSAPELGR